MRPHPFARVHWFAMKTMKKTQSLLLDELAREIGEGSPGGQAAETSPLYAAAKKYREKALPNFRFERHAPIHKLGLC